MKHKVSIPKSLKFGGFDYSIDMSQSTVQQLMGRGHYGECAGMTKEIRLDSSQSPQQLSETFIHECLEAVSTVWCDRGVAHDHLSILATGLHQVLEQLEVRFVR